jgi:hypothetical protein
LKRVELLAPEEAAPRQLEAHVQDGRVRFVLPEILVYGVARLLLD